MRNGNHHSPDATTKRTRAHRIADLSRHYFEGFVLKRGYTIVKPEGGTDYGYDLFLFTYDYGGSEEGAYENGSIYIQLKATDHLETLADGKTIAFPIKCRHANLWRRELMPVILVVFDAQRDEAYWLHLQPYLKAISHRLTQDQQWLTVHIPNANRVNEDAIEAIRDLKLERVRFLASFEDP